MVLMEVKGLRKPLAAGGDDLNYKKMLVVAPCKTYMVVISITTILWL